MKNGVVNAVCLTNPGYEWWMEKPYRRTVRNGYKVVVSIAPDSPAEARTMADDLNACKEIVGIEVNFCPNTESDNTVDRACDIVNECIKHTSHPVIVKLSFAQPYLDICRQLDGAVAAFDLINSVPWKMVFPDEQSPLHKYKLSGSVSGYAILNVARYALIHVRSQVKSPIISGGGITNLLEVKNRFLSGANAISLGTVFLSKPGLANKICSDWRLDERLKNDISR